MTIEQQAESAIQSARGPTGIINTRTLAQYLANVGRTSVNRASQLHDAIRGKLNPAFHPSFDEEVLRTQNLKVTKRRDGYNERDLPPPRVRPKHPDSDSGSEEEKRTSLDRTTAFRAIRHFETDVRNTGITPPPGFDPNRTAAQHVALGSDRTLPPSPYVSSTQSMLYAATYSLRTENQPGRENGTGYFVEFGHPGGAPAYDLTRDDHARQVFKGGNKVAASFAKGAQETLYDGRTGVAVPAANIREVYHATELTPEQYKALKDTPRDQRNEAYPDYAAMGRSRHLKADAPRPMVIQKHHGPIPIPAPPQPVTRVDRPRTPIATDPLSKTLKR